MTFRPFSTWVAAALLLAGATQFVRAENPPATAAAEGAEESPAFWEPQQKALAALGDGFVVWESKRTGPWRIFTVKLDGTGLHQLSPDEKDRDHLCPSISPDAKRVIYLSCAKDTGSWGGGELPGQPLHLMTLDGKEDKVIVPQALKYGGGWDRAVTWINNDELLYVGVEGNTYRLQLLTGKSEMVVKKVSTDAPHWLPNSKLNFAVWAFNTPSPFNRETQMVSPLPHLGGCMPYFTLDGEWGFWESSMGGPIGIYHLNSGIVTHGLSAQNFSPHRNYIYFPNISHDNRLMAVGVAPHDKLVGGYGGYIESDYEIFVVQIDPKSLQPIGKPVRYSFDPHCDRFPDVWQAPLPLGFVSDKVPYNATWDVKAAPALKNLSGASQWDFGDGTTAAGVSGAHTYEKPGLYTVTASTAAQKLVGQIYVQAAKPPAALQATLASEREIVVAFDQPVDMSAAQSSLQSGAKITRSAPAEDGRTLRLTLEALPKHADVLSLDGITDRAQRPNAMPHAQLPLEIRIWPSNPDGLVFAFQDADKPNKLLDPTKGMASAVIRPRGWARFDHYYALRLDGGMFEVQGLGNALSKAVEKSGAMTMEFCLGSNSNSSGDVLSYGVIQKNDHKIYLKVDDKEYEIAPAAGHIVITYKDGVLRGFSDLGPGVTSHVVIDLPKLVSADLTIGNDNSGQPWFGTVEGIAFYDRALSPAEIETNRAAQDALHHKRAPVEIFDSWAVCVAQSKMPNLKDIAPYTKALAVNEYEVPGNKEKNQPPYRFRVAHWVILDKQRTRISQIRVNGDIQQTVEPFAENPQLKGEYISDSLPENPNIPLYFGIGSEIRVTRGGTVYWNLVGPATGSQKDIESPSDIEGLADPVKKYQLPAGQQWQPVHLDERGTGYVDLEHYYKAPDNCAYGVAYLNSATARPALLCVESADALKVWLNTEPSLTYQPDHLPLRGQKRVAVNLKKGWNQVVVKCMRGPNAWGFICDVLDPDGREMADVDTAQSMPPVK